MIASVSIQLERFEDATSCSKSSVMMLPTVVRKASPWSRKYSSRARLNKVVPPPEANRSASAILPLLKQHSTAAVRLPTSNDCLMSASGPTDQSVLVVTSPAAGALLASAAASAAAASASSAACFSRSVVAVRSSKNFSANSSSTGAKVCCAGAAPALVSFSSDSGGGPMRVIPGRLPRNFSASETIRSWSKPSNTGTRWRPASSNCEPMSSHIKPSCEPGPPLRRVLSWQ
mmetsp:Transcript_33615/g.86033  ORF Transcript_33615/g.86033 Transcript_33615/m.86033 type:complete len:231 (+) Transcript_33615:925-1617(+)